VVTRLPRALVVLREEGLIVMTPSWGAFIPEQPRQIGEASQARLLAQTHTGAMKVSRWRGAFFPQGRHLRPGLLAGGRAGPPQAGRTDGHCCYQGSDPASPPHGARTRSGQLYDTTSLGPTLLALTAAPVPSTTLSMPPEPLRNTVSRSFMWMPEALGTWNAMAFSIATPWSK
jgi:hypothetical protein